MDPATIAMLANIAAQGIKGGMEGAESSKARKFKKKELRERKRQTLADFYNRALERELDTYKFGAEERSTNAARRAAALQESANAFRSSLR